MGALQDLALDLARFRRAGRGRTLRDRVLLVISTEELWVIVTYRIARWAMFECRIPVLRQVVSFVARAHLRLLRLLLHVWIAPQARIGGGLCLNHFGAVWVNPNAVLGRFCNLHQGVTIGIGGTGEGHGVPRLGDRVNIGPYAVILGRITIGNDVGIGANSLVVSDLPDGAVAVGVPARIVSRLGGGIPEDPTLPEEFDRPPPAIREARERAARVGNGTVQGSPVAPAPPPEATR
jgi:serine O-acetyltransferase